MRVDRVSVAARVGTVLGSRVRHPRDAVARGALLPPPRRPAPRRGPHHRHRSTGRRSSSRRSTNGRGRCRGPVSRR